MQLNEYQQLAGATNQYPKENMLECLVLGLCSEAGEVAGKLKKFYRGDFTKVEFREVMEKEVGDCLWYISEICREIEVSLDYCAFENIRKLKDRARRNKIKGNGDNR